MYMAFVVHQWNKCSCGAHVNNYWKHWQYSWQHPVCSVHMFVSGCAFKQLSDSITSNISMQHSLLVPKLVKQRRSEREQNNSESKFIYTVLILNTILLHTYANHIRISRNTQSYPGGLIYTTLVTLPLLHVYITDLRNKLKCTCIIMENQFIRIAIKYGLVKFIVIGCLQVIRNTSWKHCIINFFCTMSLYTIWHILPVVCFTNQQVQPENDS